MQQLSYLDATFLFLESNHSPMHVGGSFIFQHPPKQKMTFSRFKNHLQSRLQTSPIFRRRLVEMPLDFDLPYWIEDPKFNVENHLLQYSLREGTQEEVVSKVEEFFSQPLDRDHPLWEVLYIDGLKSGGDFAFAMKVHHCAIDGVSGEEILMGLLDFTEAPRSMKTDTWEADPFPNFSSLLGKKFKKSSSRSPGPKSTQDIKYTLWLKSAHATFIAKSPQCFNSG
ncbi:MAG: hypothetical protein JKY24_02485 [Pseudomonadales bacterium]|nr:hypothetical protein [Pseudomonadales bacterium]